MAISSATELQILVKTTGEQNLRRLSNELSKVGTNTAKAGFSFDKSVRSLKRLQAANVKSINNTRAFSNSWKELAASVEFGSIQFKEAAAESRKLDAQLAKMQGRTRGGRLGGLAKSGGAIAAAGVFGGAEGALGAGIGAVMGGPLGAAAGGAIGAQVGMVRQQVGETATYAADLEKQKIALRGVTGDVAQYTKALEFVNKQSDELAIPQDILIRQFTQLTASVVGAGGTLEESQAAFEGVASGIRGTGGSLEDMKAAMTATSQVFSKGKVSAEELRQQLGERLPGAFTLFAKSMDKTPAELDKALEQGKVTLDDFNNFAKTLFAEYEQTAKLIADSPAAAGDRLAKDMSRLKESLGTLLGPMGAEFQNMSAVSVKALDNLIRKVNEFFGLGKTLEEQRDDIYDKLEAKIYQMDVIRERIAELETGTTTERGEAKFLQYKLDNLDKETNKLIKQQDIINNKLELSKKVNDELGKGGQEAQKAWVSTGQVLTSIANTLASGIGNAIQGLIRGTQTLGQAFTNILGQLAEIILMAGIKNALASTSMFSFLKTNAKGNVYAQNGIVPFAQGGIVDSPTIFPFANGVGLMGEAGPEAIMPLTRGPDGRLGVEALEKYSGSGSSGSFVSDGDDVGEGGSSGGGTGAIAVTFNTQVINEVSYDRYAEVEQGVTAAAQQGAKLGEQATLRKLQTSPSVRRRVGV